MKSDIKTITILGGMFFFFFLALTPLGLFNDWIPTSWHTGYYSVTQIDHGDDTGYYAYLRSAFFDGDLDFINENKYLYSEKFTPTGYVYNNWQIGQSILFFPFFLLGHLSAIFLNSFGFSFTTDGYSSPYYMATAIAAQTYILLGLMFLYKNLIRYFSQSSALVATIGVWLGSPLIYFSFIRQRMAHGTEFFLSIIFITVWLLYRNSRNKYHHALLGLFFGLLCSIRMINVVYLSLYIVDQAAQWLRNNERKNHLKQHITEIIYFGLFSALALAPQLLVWNQLNGSLLSYINKSLAIMSGQTSSSSASVSLGEKVFQLFIGPKWSMILSTPILLLGTLGIFFIRKSAKELFPGIIVFIFSIFIVAITNPDSASYGNRYLLPSIGIFAFGVAGVMDRLKIYRNFFKGGILLIALFIIMQYLILVQYKTSLPYNHSHFTLKALSEIPNLFSENNHLLSRSTNFFKIIFSDKLDGFNKEDFLFLFLYPSVQLVFIILIGFLFLKFNKMFEENIFSKNAFIFILISNLICFFYLFKIMPDKTPHQIKVRHIYEKFLWEGDLKVKDGHIEEGLSLFSDAAKNLPDHWGSYFKIGSIYSGLLDYKTANIYYKKVLELNPYQADSYRNLGRNNFRLGHYEEAELFLKKSIQLDPRNKESFYYLAMVLFADQKRIPETIKMFETSLTLDPNYKIAHLNFAIILGLLKQTEKSILHFKEASRLGVKKEKIQEMTSQLGLSFKN
jgi:tetratricopeptide (TPR) repeat protein